MPAHDLQKALDPGIWPLRVKVREYVYYSKKKDSAQQHQRTSQSSQETSQEVPSKATALTVPTLDMPKDLPQNGQVPPEVPALTVSNMYDVLSNVDAAGNPL